MSTTTRAMVGLSIAYGLLIVVVLILGAQFVAVSQVENYVKLVGVGIAGLGGLFTFIASFVIGVRANKELEQLKTRGTRDTERLKAVLGKTVEAYQILNAAASLFFQSLARLETGQWEPGWYDAARNEMAKAAGSQGLLAGDKPFVNLWKEFFQEGAAIGERASKLNDPQARKNLWTETGAKFGGHLNDLQDAQRHAMEELVRDDAEQGKAAYGRG